MIGCLIAVVWFFLVGAAAERLIGDVPRWLAGAGACGLVLFILGVLHVPFVAGMIATGGAALAVIIFRSAPARVAAPRPALLDAVTAIPLVIVLAYTLLVPLHDYDGCAFWMLKAKAIATEHAIDATFFRGAGSTSLRNQYPLLVPLDVASVMSMRGSIDDHDVWSFYALLLIAFVLEVRRRAGVACAALVAWIPQLATAPEGGAISAYSDIALAAFVAMALFDLLDDHPLRFGFWTACVVLTKDEGLPFAVILLVAAAIVLRKRVAPAIAPVVVAIATLFVWRMRVPRTDEEDLLGLMRTLPSHFDRLATAVSQFAAYFVHWSDWGLLWIAVVIAAVLAWRRALVPAIVIAGMCAVYIAILMVTAWNIADLLHVSGARLITHFVGPAIAILKSKSQKAESRNASLH